MKIKEIREMTDAELQHLLEELQREKLNLYVQSRTGELQNNARIRGIRRDIARIKTEKKVRSKK